MRGARIPATYLESRSRFRRVAAASGLVVDAHPIAAPGPGGVELTVDITTIGAVEPRTALVLLSGVHGVEGFVNSALQTDLIGDIDQSSLGPDVAIVVVHVVNPWGMAHDRRQNESNVDLNRNWRRTDRTPDRNAGYDELHTLLCPDTDVLPDAADVLGRLGRLADDRGVAWLVDSVTRGQYHHPDGLHFGGFETEASCRILEREIAHLLATAERVLTVDLHTGVGPTGALTLLSNRPPDSPQHEFLTDSFGTVDATVGTTDPVSTVKSGPIASGLADVLPGALCFAVTAEFGTASDLEQLAATYQEQWVHRRGDVSDPAHAAARRRYRRCFTPDDIEWERAVRASGRRLLDRAVDAVVAWT